MDRYILIMTVLLATGQPGPGDPADFTPAGAPAVVTWSMKRLDPPSALYVTVDDVLRIAAASSQTNEVVTVTTRLLRALDGKFVVQQFTIQPGSNRAVVTKDNALTEGFLISASCQASVATTRGQTFVRLMLTPSAAGKGQPAQMLMADYVTTAIAPGYPNGRIVSPQEGPGWVHSLFQAAPGTGNQWTFTVPSNARWKPTCIFSSLVTNGAAGNRFPSLAINVGGIEVYIGLAEQAVPAGTTALWFASKTRNAPAATLPDIWVPIPADLVNLAGDSLGSFTIGMNAGDAWTGPQIAVEEWLDNV